MKRQISILTAAIAFLLIMLSYQNCGIEPAGSLFKSSDAFPFPYEISMDQVAYMSCSEQLNIPNEPGVLFTFRAGAYGANAGIRLSEKFYYDTRREDQHERKDRLATDGVSTTRMQFALRQRSSLNLMFTNGDSAGGLEEQDFDYVLGDMGSDIMSATLLNAPVGTYVNYLPAAGVNPDAYFQGTLVYNTSENLSQQTRTFLTQNGTVALGFSPVDKPANLRTPLDYADDDDGDGSTDDPDENDSIGSNQALGVGLKMTFKQPTAINWYATGIPQLAMPKRVLATVTEFDLSNPGGPQKSWSCPSTMQFRIVFPGAATTCTDPGLGAVTCPDADPTRQLCPPVNDPAVLDLNNPVHRNLQMARRSLPASDWYINMEKHCVIPKRYVVGSCYGVNSTDNLTRDVLYYFTKPDGVPCGPAASPAGGAVCAHFVSICFK